MRILFINTLLLSFSFVLLVGCGGPQVDDVHNVEPGAYAEIDVSTLELDGLKTHLERLKVEITSATENDQFGQMHYLEVSLTETLNAVDPLLPDVSKKEAGALIEKIRPLATKLHIAGHDRNASIARKVGITLGKQIDELLGLLN